MYYTKYRPQKFTEVVRPNEAADVISKQVKTGKTVHAYLFVGPRGTGKTTLARILAKALNCKKLEENGDPCGKCDVCVSVKEGNFVDLIEIDAASNRGIDDIRDLKDRVRLAPASGKRKVYIIDEVHMLTTEAFNALLKTLEEPPKNVIFILCTTESHKVPDTIKSRCQVFKFRRATVGQLVDKLKEISKEEKLKISEASLVKIAQVSLGGFRDAETLFQQVAEGDLSMEALLSVSSDKVYIEFVDGLVNKNAISCFKIVSKVYEEGVDLYLWVGELLKYLREMLFIKSGTETGDVTDELLVEIKEQSKTIKTEWVVTVINKLIEAQKLIKGSFIPQLPVEIFISEICNKGSREEGEVLVENVSRGKPSPKNHTDVKVDEEVDKEIDEKEKKVAMKDEEVTTKNEEIATNEEEIAVNDEEVAEEAHLSEVPLISLEDINAKWQDILVGSKELNHSITALLKSGKPVAVKGKFVIFEVFFAFHKERLESPKNQQLIETLLQQVYGVTLSIKCSISLEKPANLKKGESGVLTDFNVSIPTVEKGSLLDVFDGSLPAIN